MRVRIPSPLHDYTSGRSETEATGATLTEVVADLDRQFPGLRFRIIDEQDRIRTHIRFFVAGHMARVLETPVGPSDEVMIVAAISGG